MEKLKKMNLEPMDFDTGSSDDSKRMYDLLAAGEPDGADENASGKGKKHRVRDAVKKFFSFFKKIRETEDDGEEEEKISREETAMEEAETELGENGAAGEKGGKRARFPMPFPWKALTFKNALVVSCLLLIAVAGYVNVRYYMGDFTEKSDLIPVKDTGTPPATSSQDEKNDGEKSGSEKTSSYDDADDYFAVAAISRRRSRDESLEVLMTMMETGALTEQQKESVAVQMTRIADEISAEVNIENLIKAKGMAECIAVISENGADVVVRTGGLTPSQVAQIKEIVYLNAGIHPKNIRIIEKQGA